MLHFFPSNLHSIKKSPIDSVELGSKFPQLFFSRDLHVFKLQIDIVGKVGSALLAISKVKKNIDHSLKKSLYTQSIILELTAFELFSAFFVQIV
ncbi:hypothetical protein BpHYR1_011881 [Brachionus plicatilis]|uniref:Uncharacterized protein n=1 Tax=Brachionus plicatilis TaxID=10195 RepID=A0A3M7RQ52_BRAPC|nr:hypothetical protein BpHYR1_011881 [Brachionus plicatilis]